MKEKQNKQCADDDSKKTACKNKNNRKRNLWSQLDGSNWADLLAVQPQFADKCKWNKFGGGDWASLLAEQPQLVDIFENQNI